MGAPGQARQVGHVGQEGQAGDGRLHQPRTGACEEEEAHVRCDPEARAGHGLLVAATTSEAPTLTNLKQTDLTLLRLR